jgi:hypothetical protein
MSPRKRTTAGKAAGTIKGIVAELAFVTALGGSCCLACLLAFLAAR